MPEIVTERYAPLRGMQNFHSLSCDGLKTTLKEVKLEEVESSTSAILEPLARGRGLRGLSDE